MITSIQLSYWQGNASIKKKKEREKRPSLPHPHYALRGMRIPLSTAFLCFVKSNKTGKHGEAFISATARLTPFFFFSKRASPFFFSPSASLSTFAISPMPDAAVIALFIFPLASSNHCRVEIGRTAWVKKTITVKQEYRSIYKKALITVKHTDKHKDYSVKQGKRENCARFYGVCRRLCQK